MVSFQNLYFDRVYTPVYDYTVGKIAPYLNLQAASILKLNLKPGASLLSIGVGTGNEIARLLPLADGKSISVTAVDLSLRALHRVRAKAEQVDGVVRPAQGDAHDLAFRSAAFDRVLCLHTMDFLESPEKATAELIRVLRPGGEFVVTFPSGKGGGELGSAVVRSAIDSIRHGRVGHAASELAAGFGAALAYLPLALTTKPADPEFFNPGKIARLMDACNIKKFEIAEDSIYQDFLVHGIK